MFRFWHGPIIGLRLEHLWEGYAARIFLQFGRLHPSKYTRPDGSPGQPEGEFQLTNMHSWSTWELSLKGKSLATSEGRWPIRAQVLERLLIGRRLQSIQIEARTRSTRLTFTRALVLNTETLSGCRGREPHWLLRLPTSGSDDWPHVVLPGTSSGWRSNIPTTSRWRDSP
jgi:hypothetical protein